MINIVKDTEQLHKAINIFQTAETLYLPCETKEARLLMADIQIKSQRLMRILAKRVACDVREQLDP